MIMTTLFPCHFWLTKEPTSKRTSLGNLVICHYVLSISECHVNIELYISTSSNMWKFQTITDKFGWIIVCILMLISNKILTENVDLHVLKPSSGQWERHIHF